MRRVLLVLSTVLAAVVAVAGPAAAARAQDYVRGNAFNGAGTVVFSVTSDPDGSNVRGRVRFVESDGKRRQNVYEGIATCLVVRGNQASVAGTIVSARGPSTQPVTNFVLAVEDLSPATPFADGLFYLLITAPLDCFNPGGTGSIQRGHVVVHDAP
jgi:hypothetical protein